MLHDYPHAFPACAVHARAVNVIPWPPPAAAGWHPFSGPVRSGAPLLFDAGVTQRDENSSSGDAIRPRGTGGRKS
ncbi:hypothetical protein [Massilia horti]|uniref:Uncharacterized protein n=1 Tax=Massilia horti TaxID=2562153 RepID=A0A4Y9T0P1_9BURK|nr:hypothetical protein [Massilia horti]TFW32346.1 hypothetical protein E4O92_10290 [Massilia horti]